MSETRSKIAEELWKVIQSNLEDRSLMDLGTIDDDLVDEIKAEQIAAIKGALLTYANQASPYSVR